MQLPSNKVGLVLIGVVLISSATVFFSKYQRPKADVKDLQNVDILVARNTDQFDRSSDSDNDGLLDWQEDLYKSDPNDPDTDDDGTSDGEEVLLKRNPVIAGPNDPLLTTKDYFNTDFDSTTVATGTITQKLSVDLASEYFMLKKNNKLTGEAGAELVSKLAQDAVTEAQIKDRYTSRELITITSNNETIKKYGEDFARTFLKYYKILDGYKNLSDTTYLENAGKTYKELAGALANMNIPTVAIEVHLRIINGIDQTGLLFERLSDPSSDPVSVLVAIGNQQRIAQGDLELYTSISNYFKESGIIFDDEEVSRFWSYYAN